MTDAAVVFPYLSRTGLLIETDAAFSLGETFLLVLPELGAAPARVVRADGRRFGCEFLPPVPASASSAALLKGAHEAPASDDASPTATPHCGALYPRRHSLALLFPAPPALFSYCDEQR